MRGIRAAVAGSVAGVIISLAACTGTSPQVPSPSLAPSASVSASPSSPAVVTSLANGKPLPEGCPTADSARGHTVAFVASGNAWALDPRSGDAICLFPAAAPEPFTWNPRGDRALLSGLAIESIRGEELRAGTSSTTPVSSWGHPIGKAVVYISPDGTRLRKIYPGTQRQDDVTPVRGVEYLNVIYHPSGLAFAFVIDTGDGQEIWLSSNLGEDPVRLVFAVGETTFGALEFTADGRTLLYAAVHGDDAPLLHAIDLTDPTVNQGLWHGDPGARISTVFAQPELEGEAIAFTVGTACEDARAMLFRRGREARPLSEAPSRVVGWLDARTVLVASGGCDGPSDLAAVDLTDDATLSLVAGVDLAATRTPLLGFVPPLPSRIEQEVGEGVG